jgi:CDP-paratose 2-epimerase
MKYLITGGCGFLGSNLAAEVLKNKEELIILDNLYRYGSYGNLEWLKSKDEFQFIHADIRNAGDVENVIKEKKPEVIFHLAGQVAMAASLSNPGLDFEINAVGSFNLLEAVRKYSPETTVIYSSTNKVYGDLEYFTYEEHQARYICKEHPNGFDESLRLDFHSPYGCSKGAADQYMLDYSRMFGLKTVVFRHSSMYGARQFATYEQGWVGWFCQKAMETKRGVLKKPFTISGNGKQVRDLLYSEDMKRLYFSAVEHIEQAKGQAFNIGGGMENSLSLIELFAVLEELTGCKLLYKPIEWRQSDQKIFVADNKKAQKYFNWRPGVNSKEGVSNLLNWIETEL